MQPRFLNRLLWRFLVLAGGISRELLGESHAWPRLFHLGVSPALCVAAWGRGRAGGALDGHGLTQVRCLWHLFSTAILRFQNH